jgi:hypothetical protein
VGVHVPDTASNGVGWAAGVVVPVVAGVPADRVIRSKSSETNSKQSCCWLAVKVLVIGASRFLTACLRNVMASYAGRLLVVDPLIAANAAPNSAVVSVCRGSLGEGEGEWVHPCVEEGVDDAGPAVAAASSAAAAAAAAAAASAASVASRQMDRKAGTANSACRVALA